MHTCKTCRFWSQLVAKASGGEMTSMCLTERSGHAAEYMPGSFSCAAWKEATHGSIDMPTKPGAYDG